MNKVKQHITIIFLVVFTLIKVSPLYYGLQLFPLMTGNKASQVISSSGYTNGAFGVKVDKAITDKVDRSNIPSIKYSGILLTLFFASLLLLSHEKLNSKSQFPVSFQFRPFYILQAVFRL